MYWQWIAGVTAGLVLLDLAFRLYCARLILTIFDKPLRLRVDDPPAAPQAERVAIASSDGITLRGSLHRSEAGPARGLVVFCPELNGSHWSAATYCRGLIDNGFDVLAFDFRNQGESDVHDGYRPLHWVTNYEIDDVRAVLKYVRSRQDLRDLPLGLMGVSRGGGAALAVAALDQRVQRVATEGAFSTEAMQLHYTLRWASVYVPSWLMRFVPMWHTRGTLFLCRLLSQRRRRCRYANLPRLLPCLKGRPVLLIAGEADSYVPMSIPQEMTRQIGGNAWELWTVPQAKHNRARRADPHVYDEKLTAFFEGMTEPFDESALPDEVGFPAGVRRPEPTASA